MSTQSKTKYSVKEYLLMERDSDIKHEYLNGEIFAMVGASFNDNCITSDVHGELRAQLKDRNCNVLAADMRVKIPKMELYTYPDIVVLCEQPKIEKIEGIETLLNPQLIVEILSPSTEGYDKGKKFDWYRKIESFQEYLLIAQDRVHVMLYVRQADNKWLLSETKDLSDTIKLPITNCELSLKEIYRRVTFEPHDTEPM